MKEFAVRFTAPSGRVKKINGFWDGGRDWKVRFCPDEKGTWTFETSCSDAQNKGLHGVKGSFECVANDSKLDIYTKGGIVRPKGCYYLTHADGTPFFFTACTAWNGALKSTEDEWLGYLTHRAEHGYNVIQFVTTQWRGCDKDAEGQVAFEGSGRIRINPDFYKRLDHKVDQINEHGLVAAPVLLWALPVAEGRELSPGYYLPDDACDPAGSLHGRPLRRAPRDLDSRRRRPLHRRVRAAMEEHRPGRLRRRASGRRRSASAGATPGSATLTRTRDWLDLIGYQSSHSAAQGTVDWITKGPMAKNWDKLPARPTINLEPCYEGISDRITDRDVRNASYWSILATPTAGITYGANGIWPWLREGEEILNHGRSAGVATWDKCLDFPASIQIGYLAEFMRTLPWWRLKPRRATARGAAGRQDLQSLHLGLAGRRRRHDRGLRSGQVHGQAVQPVRPRVRGRVVQSGGE